MEIRFEDELKTNPSIGPNCDAPLFTQFNAKEISWQTYDEIMNEAGELIRGDYDEYFDAVSDFQYDFMREQLRQYALRPMEDVRNGVYELMSYAVNMSESGNTIEEFETEDIAEMVRDELYEAFGWAVLDCEVYEEKGMWCVDAMIGGSYVPQWDGWRN